MVTNQVANCNSRNREDDETKLDKLTSENCHYRAIRGSLQYLARTVRPDISYAVNVLSH